VFLTACAGEATGKTFRYDIQSPVSNLDPQYATDSAARMVIANIGEGLLVRDPDGTLSPGVALSYTVSPDGLVYTFTLREDAGWAGKDPVPVTAHDFVFAFHRMFNAAAPSPFAADYIHIENARAVLDGAPLTGLGVRAEGDYTLVITLTQKTPLFLELLASTAAMPCNRTAFEGARGRYGLEKEFVGANGPFYIEKWTDTQITLARNEHYVSGTPVLAGGVQFVIGREKSAQRFLDGNTDITALPFENVGEAESIGSTIETFEKITWCIVFNQNIKTWGNPLLRQGLAYGLDYDYLAQRLTDNLTPTSVLVPPAARVGDTVFRDAADASSPLTFDPQNAARIFQMGLNALEYDSLPPATFYVPDTDGHALNMGLVQQSWQKNLSVFVTVQAISPGEIQSRFASGDFHIMLMPFSPSDANVETLLSAFRESSSQNNFGFYNPRFDDMLNEAAEQEKTAQMLKKYIQAEMILLADAVVIPVYNETTYYAMGKGVSGITVQPFGNMLRFKQALKS
jgi:oligopeptide transport system substrate-binding protein